MIFLSTCDTHILQYEQILYYVYCILNIVLCIMYIMYTMYIMYMTYDIHHSNCLYIYGKHAGKKLGSLLYTCIYIYI